MAGEFAGEGELPLVPESVVDAAIAKIVGHNATSWVDPNKATIDHTERPEDGTQLTSAAEIPEAGKYGAASAVLIRIGDKIVKRVLGTPDD